MHLKLQHNFLNKNSEAWSRRLVSEGNRSRIRKPEDVSVSSSTTRGAMANWMALVNFSCRIGLKTSVNEILTFDGVCYWIKTSNSQIGGFFFFFFITT